MTLTFDTKVILLFGHLYAIGNYCTKNEHRPSKDGREACALRATLVDLQAEELT